jgi:putative membrane protein
MAHRARRRRPSPLESVLLIALLAILIWSAIRPRDRFTWWLEAFPVLVGVPLLIAIYPRCRFTPLVYTLIFAHAAVLLVGAHYTYAHVPLFDWLRDALGLSRNHYDRVGHFMQGFVPAMIAREILLRTSPLRRGKWLFTIVLMMCMGFSAIYELIEWAAAALTGSAADAFLATQGDVWDTQKDMALCGIGAILALLLLSQWHDRQLVRLPAS